MLIFQLIINILLELLIVSIIDGKTCSEGKQSIILDILDSVWSDILFKDDVIIDKFPSPFKLLSKIFWDDPGVWTS